MKNMERKTTQLQDLVTYLLSFNKGSGWPFDTKTNFAFRELASSFSERPLTDAMVMNVLNTMQQKGKERYEDFVTLCQQMFGQIVPYSRTCPTSWKFYVPFDIQLGKGLKRPVRLRILGEAFFFTSRDSVQRQLGKRKLQKIASRYRHRGGHDYPNGAEVFLTTTSAGTSYEVAWEQIEPAFDALRGLIEFSCGFSRLQISTAQKPRRLIPHPRLLVATTNGKDVEVAYFLAEDHQYTQLFVLNSERLESVKMVANRIARQPPQDSTLAVLADSFRLYAQAMDARFNYGCFLGLWQLAEAMTLSKVFGGDVDKVVSRLSWHEHRLKLVGSGVRESLGILKEKRNDIVHRGIHKITEEEVNFFKLLCDHVLLWLLRESKTLVTRLHLEQFYKLRDQSKKNLAAMKGCINYVNKLRKKR